ncbi:DUF4426 domain-containing protein [Neptunicella sp. SCSIO 80796]|uniref:DUF4426 domain-containing protein n=1 Tax=Neptunicella plasticusilytica TaxID=3117012 RepID=UPI003A4DD267
MRLSFKSIIASLLLLCSVTHAEQLEKLGPWDVHYIVIPSTFITPEISKAYGLQRSKYKALINISVLDSQSKEAQSVVVSGTAKNLLGQIRQLDFQEVKEQQSIYYLAQFTIDDDELWRFDITVRHGNDSQKLMFKQKVYAE